jgi:hypothetical protein
VTEDEAPHEVADEVSSAAAGTRKAALWIASALGGIPALAIIGALVRAPGESGFSAPLLALGIGSAAIGAAIGIFAFARVIEPVAVSDQKVLDAEFDVSRVIGHPFTDYQEVLDRLEIASAELTRKTYLASDAAGWAKAAEAHAARAEVAVKEAEEALADAPEPERPERTRELEQAKRLRDAAKARATAFVAEAAVVEETRSLEQRVVNSLERVRAQVFMLHSSDRVRARYDDARATVPIAVMLVAVGIFCLGMAPITEAEETTDLKLLTLTLESAGQEALGCREPSVQAIQVGGVDDARLVITLPTANCDAKKVVFTTSDPVPLGRVTEEEAIEAPPG